MPKRKRNDPPPLPVARSISTDVRWPLWVMAAILACLGVVPLANIVTIGAGLPWWRDAVKEWIVWGIAIGGLALLLARFLPRQVDAATAAGRRLLLAPSPQRFAWMLAVVTFALSLFFGWRLFSFAPSAGDELTQRFQAHLLTLGRLHAQMPAYPEFFDTNETLNVAGRWFGQFPVGGPAFLAVGMFLHIPWIINPLLAAVAVVAVHRFLAAVRDEATARFASVLVALCPFLLFMAGSQMNHVATLTCIWAAFATVPVWLSAGHGKANRSAAVIGLSLGIAATIRPYDAAIAALAIGAFQTRVAMRERGRFTSILVQGLVGAIPVALLLIANTMTTGHPMSFAYDVLNGPEHRPGFHMTPLGFEHTPRRGLYVISAYLMKLDVGLLAWPVPVILLVVTTLLLLRTADRWDRLLLSFLALMLAGYAAYWSESYFLGPRFLFTCIPVFIVYVARLPDTFRARVTSPVLRRTVALLIPLWVAAAWLWPARSDEMFGIWRQSQNLSAHDDAASEILRLARRQHLDYAVVFVQEGWHGRMAARLRALGMRPLIAEMLVAQSDACTLQVALNAADRQSAPRQRMADLLDVLRRDAMATPVPQQTKVDQLAFVQGRELLPECRDELSQVTSSGVSLAQMLPYMDFDSRGALGGRVIYARDLGRRNELLRREYGNRAWYVASVKRTNGALSVSLDPYAH